MGFGLQTPLLDGQQQPQQQPSAPPLCYAAPPPSQHYPQIGVMPPHAMGVPAAPDGMMAAPGVPVMQHVSGAYAPAAAPPYPVLVEQHLHLPDDPVISRVAPHPHPHSCPACGSAGPTRVKREAGLCTYAVCFGMCWMCCPLFWLPFCLDCDRDLVHRCSACGTEVARIKPI